MDKTKNRIFYWDNIKGFLMLLTVFAHMLLPFQDNEAINSIFDYIYMFHMPAFVFLSGFFGKSDKSHGFEAIIKLVFLYFIFNSAMWLIYGDKSILEPMYSYWYLIALVVWRLTAHHLAKFSDITLILGAVAIIIGFFPSVDNSFAASRIISFYPFYMSGYLLPKEKGNKLAEETYSRRIPKGIMWLALASAAAFVFRTIFRFTDDSLLMFGYTETFEAFGRLAIIVTAVLALMAMRYIAPSKEIPLLSMMGRNSLWIFLIHRPITLVVSSLIENSNYPVIISASAAATIVICIAFGNNYIAAPLNRFAQQGAEIFTLHKKGINAAKLAAVAVASAFVIHAVAGVYSDTDNTVEELTPAVQTNDVLYRTMSAHQHTAFDNAFRLTFAGDLILLEDQVKRAYNGSGYDFSDVFEYTEGYISSADLAIGVFEGPMAGEAAGYSTSNYDDGKQLALNFPDEFGEAVKAAGFDLVTTANNHLLDKGIQGAVRTLDKLDEIGLDHIGSYRTAAEKENTHIKLLECQGIKFAVLAYTYGSNNYTSDELTSPALAHLTSVISGTSGEQFEILKEQVRKDFDEAKSLDPDLIVVLPHIGTQFSNSIDAEQETWFGIFKEFGADIILGDHPHAVEPVYISDYNGRNIFEAYCPGNFANIYRENQGDTSILAEVYIDRNTKQIIGGGIVPLYTQASADGNFRALPIYEIQYNDDLRKELSTDDIARADNSNKIITEVLFGSRMDINSVTERYYFDGNGFMRSITNGLEITDEIKRSCLFKAMSNADSICFIGDSVTEGTKNGGCPWYEPMLEHLDGKQITNHSKGGCTVSYIIDTIGEIPSSDLYVIAIGTNDVRYRDEEVCAMTAEAFSERINELRTKLLEKNSSAEFAFIAPWYSTDGDSVSVLPFDAKLSLNEEYTASLEKFCNENNIIFINANPYIAEKLSHSPADKYLLDHIHPNSGTGVIMYSEAVLMSGE
ncbi:MAG: hypothetical protein E7508_12115 [Ruminococcus sp.]|nr:hypothetical protein [Ruminococcus sp.]